MEISDKGITWLKNKEQKVVNSKGLHVIYDDRTGKIVQNISCLPPGATIGYGHLIKSGEDFQKGLSEQQAIELLKQDLHIAEEAVRNNITAKTTQNQFDALVSFAYNIGSGNFANSTVVKYINNPQFYDSVYGSLEKAWKAWNRSQGEVSRGLINRRNAEWKLYDKGIYYF